MVCGLWGDDSAVWRSATVLVVFTPAVEWTERWRKARKWFHKRPTDKQAGKDDSSSKDALR